MFEVFEASKDYAKILEENWSSDIVEMKDDVLYTEIRVFEVIRKDKWKMFVIVGIKEVTRIDENDVENLNVNTTVMMRFISPKQED